MTPCEGRRVPDQSTDVPQGGLRIRLRRVADVTLALCPNNAVLFQERPSSAYTRCIKVALPYNRCLNPLHLIEWAAILAGSQNKRKSLSLAPAKENPDSPPVIFTDPRIAADLHP